MSPKGTSLTGRPGMHVAFLRGINMIGRKTVKMQDLRKAFEALGLADVRSIQASGNILFSWKGVYPVGLAAKIEAHLEKHLGYRVGVTLRSLEYVRTLVLQDPFKRVKMTPRTKRLVSFLPAQHNSKFLVPYKSSKGDFRILAINADEVNSVVTFLPNMRPAIMSFLDKTFGKQITTRNWNTLRRIIAAEQTAVQ